MKIVFVRGRESRREHAPKLSPANKYGIQLSAKNTLLEQSDASDICQGHSLMRVMSVGVGAK